MSAKPLTKKEWEASVAETFSACVQSTYQDLIDAAVKAEREACAKLCEPQEAHDDPLTAWKIAKAIRARGTT